MKSRIRPFFCSILLALLLAPAAVTGAAEAPAEEAAPTAQMDELRRENQEIKARLDSLEADSEETKHGFGVLSRFVEVGGYADAEFYLTDKDGDSSRFRVRHLSLFFVKDIQKEWKLFSEIEYEDAPLIESAHTTDTASTVQGKLFVEQMYIEYHPSLAWDIRFGRFLTPAGIWNIYHYPPYVPTQERPLMVRRIFPQVSDGAQARYSFSAGGYAVDTHLYAANGAGNPGRLDRNENKAVGARFNVKRGALSSGISVYGERDNSGVQRRAIGAHFLADYSPLRFQAEYQYRDNDPETAAAFIDRGFYAQAMYDIGDWTIAGRYDWYDPNGGTKDADMFRYTGALNYHFAENVVAKAEYNRNELESGEDFNEVIFSIVVAIGDL